MATVTVQFPTDVAESVVAEGMVQPAVPALASEKLTAPVPDPPEGESVKGIPNMADVAERARADCVPVATVNVSVADPVPAELVALIVELKVPAVVGVPEIWPVAVFTPSPDGRLVAL
ncbi:MAG: hypothetical protein ACKOAF_06430 [Actinomycetes bacterium]